MGARLVAARTTALLQGATGGCRVAGEEPGGGLCDTPVSGVSVLPRLWGGRAKLLLGASQQGASALNSRGYPGASRTGRGDAWTLGVGNPRVLFLDE